MPSQMLNEVKRQFFARAKQPYERCLWPFDDCSQPSVRAHSIQNAEAMDLLQRDGHVIMPVQTMFLDREPEIAFSQVGRHHATCFTGLCNHHDSDLFRPIDVNPTDPSNPEHLFLMAYRSVLKEYHTTLKCSQSLLGFMADGVDHGTIDPRELSHDRVFSIGTVADSYETYLYWMQLNRILSQRTYNKLRHEVLQLPSKTPSLAVSTIFPLQLQRRKMEVPPLMMLNIMPDAGGTHTAVFSYLPRHSQWANDFLTRLLSTSGDHLLYEVSKVILEKSENVVLSPDVFSTFCDLKKALLLEFFTGNLSGAGRTLDMDSDQLMLFA
jgi:hypothetical protein